LEKNLFTNPARIQTRFSAICIKAHSLSPSSLGLEKTLFANPARIQTRFSAISIAQLLFSLSPSSLGSLNKAQPV
jgi:hypothetical protein